MDRLAILGSYAFLREGGFMGRGFLETLIPCAPAVDILIDSGAYSEFADRLKAAKHGTEVTKTVTIEEYITFCKNHLHGVVWQYIQLDRINDHPGTITNLRTMVDAGLTPMPVVVAPNIELQDLEEMIQVNEHLSSGGGAGGGGFIKARYRRIVEASDNRAKLHGLGFCRIPALYSLPLYSCDSSAWCASTQFGTVTAYRLGKFHKLSYHELDQPASGRVVFFRDYLRDQGIDIEAELKTLRERKNNVFSMLTASSILSYFQLSLNLADYGIRYFFATPNVWWFLCVAAVYATFDGWSKFDFNRSRELFTEWNALVKAKRFTEATDSIVKTLREKPDVKQDA